MSTPVTITRVTTSVTTARRRIRCLTILLITIPLGLAVRLLPLGLPWFFYKYLGSILWAAALYWFLGALLPKLRIITLAATSIALATIVELSRLVPIAPVDTFRQSLPGKILLGQYFSVKNICAYIVAILIAATLDAQVLSKESVTPNPASRDTL